MEYEAETTAFLLWRVLNKRRSEAATNAPKGDR
jgi:hypothetical protein